MGEASLGESSEEPGGNFQKTSLPRERVASVSAEMRSRREGPGGAAGGGSEGKGCERLCHRPQLVPEARRVIVSAPL